MVVNVSLIGHIWFAKQCSLHGLDTLFVLFEGKVCHSLFIEYLSVTFIDFKCSVKVINRLLVVAHVVVTLGSIFEELNVLGILLNGLVEVFNGLSELPLHVIALAKSIITCRVGLIL